SCGVANVSRIRDIFLIKRNGRISRFESPRKFRIQFNRRELCRRLQRTQDVLGKGARAGSVFEDGIGSLESEILNHRLSQERRTWSNGTSCHRVRNELLEEVHENRL